ncbi:MAG: hypothetical protein N838_20010 [Thiohalocapsa sp. PB-PSB1]|nr:MAG: hypothetical protein N838_20010 [Thiohalocapsa sp. PB-PSB1]
MGAPAFGSAGFPWERRLSLGAPAFQPAWERRLSSRPENTSFPASPPPKPAGPMMQGIIELRTATKRTRPTPTPRRHNNTRDRARTHLGSDAEAAQQTVRSARRYSLMDNRD